MINKWIEILKYWASLENEDVREEKPMTPSFLMDSKSPSALAKMVNNYGKEAYFNKI